MNKLASFLKRNIFIAEHTATLPTTQSAWGWSGGAMVHG